MRLVLAILLVMFAVPVYAQAPTSWLVQVYAAGGAAIGPAQSIAAPAVVCGQAKTTGANTNPTQWRWDDPTDPTRDCVFNDATRLNALADGNYEGTIRAVNADGTSAESARVPFTRRRPQPPAVPTGLRLTQ